MAEFKNRVAMASVTLAINARASRLLRAGRSWDRMGARVRIYTSVQFDTGTYPASCEMGTASPLLDKVAGGMGMTTHTHTHTYT